MKKTALIFLLSFITLCLSGCENLSQAQAKEAQPYSNQYKSENHSLPKASEPIKNQETIEKELISYKTPLLDKRKGRLENIRLAIKAINGKQLNPNQEFSFNETVGRRTINRGYKEAIIFKENKKEKEVGGGICQVSSTLHAAAKMAGLEITERHTHQLPVSYIDEQNDATVYYGELDLKFKNNTLSPIRIYMILEKDDVLVTISSILQNTY